MTKSEWFKARGSFTSSLTALVLDMYGSEVLDWEPEILKEAIEKDCAVTLPSWGFDRINCGLSLLSNDTFFKALEVFLVTCNVLNMRIIDSEMVPYASIDDMVLGVVEAKELIGPEIWDDAKFCPEIQAYAGNVLSIHGMTKAPAILNFAEFDAREIQRTEESLALSPEDTNFYFSRQMNLVQELDKMANDKVAAIVEQFKQLPLSKNKQTL